MAPVPGRPGPPPPPPPNKSSPRTPPPHRSPRTPPRKRSPDDGASSSAMLSTPPTPPAQNSSPSTTQMVANPPADGRINPQWQAHSTVGASPSLWQMQNSPGAIPRSPSLRENSRGSPSSANQIVAASPADGRINPQYQIHGSPGASPTPFNRKNPPPPPPPRRTNSSQQLVAASRELHRSQSFTRKESGGSPSMLDGSGRSGASSKERARSGSLSGSFKSNDSRGSRGSLRRERSNSLNSTERAGIQVHPSGDEFEENAPTQHALSNSARELLAGLSRNHQKEAAMLRAGGESEPLRAGIEDEDEEEPPKHLCDRVCSAMMCVFPKVEPLPWGQFAILTLWCGIPPACYVLLFTQMGAGEQIYYTVAIELGEHASALAAGLAAYVVALYMLDADQWASRCGSVLRDLSILAVVVGTVVLVLMIADRYPYGMICLFAIFQPLWLLGLKLMTYAKKDTRVFVSWLSGPLFFTSVTISAAWALWVFSDPDNEWNKVARTTAAERTGCVPDYEGYPECRKEEGSDETCFYVDKHDGTEELVFPEGCDQACTHVYDGCLNGFIVWVGPVLVGLVLFFLSTFCTFLRSEGAREKDVLNFGAVWIFILFALWVTTSLSGVAAGVTSALAALTLASFVASAMFLAVSFSKEERNKNAAAVFDRMREKYGKNLDVARGLFVVTCAPIVLVYFGFSITNQFIRKSSIFSCTQPPGAGGDIFTTRTRKQVEMIKKWDRAKVYTIAVYWGIAFMVLQVLVANLTVVFLSWMIEKMSGFGLAAVTAIMAGVGILMFLLPPVPGVPVYLSLGIVLPAQGHELLGWAGSIAYSVAIGLCLKLFACALQQKMIGENLSHYVKVRQFVGINSTLIKAMRLVLGKSGFSVPKVAILIGGPDWPTSVLCGIMRLALLQILLGTTPIVALIAPTCLTGALLYMASLETDTGNPQFPWAGTVSTISASLTAIVQFGSMLIAAYYLEQTANRRAAEVEAIPIDREVKEADDKAAHLRQCYRDVTQWEVIPTSAKLLIQTSLACIVTSSYLVQLFGSLCFTEHSLTDSIDDNLDGKVSNLFLPLGWVAVSLFCLSMLLIYLFESWGEKKAYSLATGVSVSPTALDDSSTAAVPERLSRSAHSVT